jgi:hypothetical protein
MIPSRIPATTAASRPGAIVAPDRKRTDVELVES